MVRSIRAMSAGAPAVVAPPATGWQPARLNAAAIAAAPLQPSRCPRSVIAVGLVARVGGREGVEFHAFAMDAGDRRVGAEIELVALGIDHLRR